MRFLARLVALFVFVATLPASPVRGGEAEREAIAGYRTLRSASGTFVIWYPPRLEGMARETEALLERSASDIAGELGLETIGAIRVYIAGDDETYRKLQEAYLPEWSSAFSSAGDRTIGIRATSASSGPRSLRAMVRHELSHMLLAERVGGVPLPAWFMEGLAMMQAGEWSFVDEWNFMLLVGRRRLPYLEEIAGPFPSRSEDAALAYALSHRAVSQLLREAPGSLLTLTAFIRDRGDFEDAFFLTFGMTPYDHGSRVYVGVHERYRTPGAVLNAFPYWLAASALVVAAFIAKRARTRRRLREMEERETGTSSFSS